jgi:hypothetical protein
MLTPPLDASATNYLLLQKLGNVFLPQQQPMFCSSQFCGCSQSRIIPKNNRKKYRNLAIL